MKQTIHSPVTQADYKGMAFALGARYRHAFGEAGAVFYAHELGGVFVLTDNGGELNVSGLNRVIDLPSIPVIDGVSEGVGLHTAGYRVRVKLLGFDIDYALDMDAELGDGACAA